jgi:F-type H+-transporting ATPase subunit epsilon
MTFHLLIITPNQKVFEGNVNLLTVMTSAGQMGILAKHTPLLSVVKTSELHIQEGKKTTYFATSGGVVSVQREKVLLLLDTIEQADQIDLNRAKESLKRAEERLKEKTEKVDEMRAKAAITRALNRISIKEKYTEI